MIQASWSGVTSLEPAMEWEMSWFWQKAQSRLQPAKKMVPEPPVPTRGSSSPKWRV